MPSLKKPSVRAEMSLMRADWSETKNQWAEMGGEFKGLKKLVYGLYVPAILTTLGVWIAVVKYLIAKGGLP